MPRSSRRPSYTLHKATGQARVRIGSTDFYLGKYNSPESLEQYEELMCQMYVNRGVVRPSTLTVGELSLQFIKHADAYYRRDGIPTGEATNFRAAIKQLNALYRSTLVREFGPKKLLAVRERLIQLGVVRTNINRHIARIKQVFKWGVSQELASPDIYTALSVVPGLRRDRSEAIESDPVQPVPIEDVEAIKEHVTAPVWAMVQLQLLTGMRPSEVRMMRCGDIDRSGDVWTYVPRRHKTAHHGRRRIIFLGPRAQLILRPFLSGSSGQYLFRPSAGRAEFVAKKYRDGAQASVRNSTGANAPYTHHGYDSSIRSGCAAAGVAPWSPGRLRHNAATTIRREFGDIDAARCVLGHASPSITQIYAEKDFDAARAVVARIG